MDYRIRNLEADDWPALYAFELANRAWFEQHIDPREPSFYTHEGVRQHVRELMDSHAAGRWHPCVIDDGGGRIVGRANLKSIDGAARSAEVGYRIAASHAGKGLATRALAHLVALARGQWQLATLRAVVTAQNEASAAVLHKGGFVYVKTLPAVALVQGATVDGRLYERAIAG